MHSDRNLEEFAAYTKPSLTSEEMHAVELNAYTLGLSEIQLMENAGTAISNFVIKKIKRNKRILIVCGLGNNGGDGFVAAKHLCKNYEVSVALLGSGGSIKSSQAIGNFNTISNIPSIKIFENAQTKMNSLLNENDAVIDSIFGTGFHGKPPHDIDNVIKAINRSKLPVIAVDVPSGLNSTTGEESEAVRADYTVTFHKCKTGLIRSKKAGKIVIADIGIPIEAELVAGPGDLYLASKARSMYSSKRDNGKVVIVGGGETFHGAPSLVSNAAYSMLAALRIGIGYAVAFVPRSVANAVRSVSPNIIVRPTSGNNLNPKDLVLIKEAIATADSLAIGPGLGRSSETLKTAAELISYANRANKRIVIDADAIYAIKQFPRKLGRNVVITPNDREFSLLYGSKIDRQDLKNRMRAAIKVANRLGSNVLLKGHDTVITNGAIIKIARSVYSSLATMGTGDVLSGIIGGYAARNKDVFVSATAGAYLHARIGDELHKEKGDHILASDVIDCIPKIIKEFDKNVV